MKVRISKDTITEFLSKYPILWIGVLLGIFPLYWLFSNSLKPEYAFFISPISLPPWPPRFENFWRAWTLSYPPLDRPFLNSIGITTASVAGILALSSAAGYSFARFRLPHGEAIFSFLLLGLSIPVHASLIPLVVSYKFMGILNTYFALLTTFVAVNLPFAVLLMRAYFVSIPEEIAESARMDAASELRIFWNIMLPIAKPGLITLAILTFMFVWNDFLFSYTLVYERELWTLPRAVYAFVGIYGEFTYTDFLAGLTIAMIPNLVVYFIFSRQLIEGIAAGSVKE